MNIKSSNQVNQSIPLPAPSVPVALEGGLIPLVHSTKPITVNFPVWDAARPKYTYQLVLDGNRVPPEHEILTTHKPGDILTVEIPVPLLSEGFHNVTYRIFSPTGNSEAFSPATTIQIDRTAPGAPELGPILFPPAVQEGLTSDELTAMHNVLAARIAGYSGMTAGDVIRTYWGKVEGPRVTVDSNDMGLKRVMVDYSRAFLERIGDGREEVYYTVTDLAGNVSMKSEAVSVDLKLSYEAPIPLPIIKEAINGVLDPANAPHGATVIVPPGANLRLGDQVRVSWKSPKGDEYKDNVIGDSDVGNSLAVVFSNFLVIANRGQRISVSYRIIRTTGSTLFSRPYSVMIEDGELALPKPTMDTVKEDGVITPGLIPESGATVRVRYDARNGDRVKVIWAGASRYETPEQTTGGSNQLVFTVPKSLIVATQNAMASVTYQVTRAGTTRQSMELKLSVLSALTFDTSPLRLSGKTYTVISHPDVSQKWTADNSAQRVAKGGVKPYTYASSNTAVARVQEHGVVWSRGNGTATISVTDATGATLSYPITVSGVIRCSRLKPNTYQEVVWDAERNNARLPTMQELREVYAAFGDKWPLEKTDIWASTDAKLAKAPIKHFGNGQEGYAFTFNKVLGVGLHFS